MLWRDLIQKKTGLHLDDNRSDFLARRLMDRMKLLGIHSFSSYYTYLSNEIRNRHEWQLLIENLMNLQTSFFRHLPSYDALIEHVIPTRIQAIRESRQHRSMTINSDEFQPIMFWSVGCSKGQEPYSLAIAMEYTLEKRKPDIPVSYQVVGMDISRNALEKAKKGEYSYFETRDMPSVYKDHYMILKSAETKNQTDAERSHRVIYAVNDKLRSRIRFLHQNIMEIPSMMTTPSIERLESDISPALSFLYDVVFCQNVFIYLLISDRARILYMLLTYLKPGGYLFLAPGETVGIKVTGATLCRFKDTLAFQRNEEAVHVQVAQ